MPWWVWIVVGVALLASEVVVTTDFYLAVLGLAAFALAAVAAGGLAESFAVQGLLYAGLSVLLLVLLRHKLGAWLGPRERLDAQLVGERAVVRETIAPGGLGRVELHGTLWSARNTGATALAVGSEAAVEAVAGLELCVRAAPADAAST
jgi:membrane protein implicated in regulation of membrane protease activity